MTYFSHTSLYQDQNIPYGFHHTGLIYHVLAWKAESELFAREKSQWMALETLSLDKLTPFAKEAMFFLFNHTSWRPSSTIREKAIGLAKQDSRLFGCEVLTDEGVLKG